MAKDLNKALDVVEMTYTQVEQIAVDMLRDIFDPLDQLVTRIQAEAQEISIDSLRYYMLQLQLNAFRLSEVRDKTAVKAQCAEAIRKEAYATSFLVQEGTAGQKDSNAIIAISESIIAEQLYELVASLSKTKIDTTLRLIDTLKAILMSRMQEYKVNNALSGADLSDIAPSGRMRLNEQY